MSESVAEVSPFFRTLVRRARRDRICPSCGLFIKSGQLYLAHTEFPGGDAGYADSAGHPVRMPECRRCAERYGRGDRFAKRDAEAKS